MKNNLRPFPFWCSKVLPLAYDDSLSYYELLCKVVAYLNNTMEDVNLLADAFEDLREHVEHWIEEGDIEEIVNARIDEMIESGEFGDIIFHAMVEVQNFRVTPYMFGAVGDGVHDDTNAFTSMLAYKNIYIPKGTYRVTSALTVADDTSIVGDGIGLSFIKYDGEITSDFISLGNRTHIVGLRISQDATAPNENYSAVLINGKTGVIVDDCKIERGAFRCMTVKNSTNVVIRNTEFTLARRSGGFGVNGSSNHVSHIKVINCSSHENALDGFISSDGYVTFEGCDSYSNGTVTNAAGFFLNNNAHNNVIHLCKSRNNMGIGIELAGASENVTIMECSVISNGSDGIESRNSVNPMIVNNYIADNTSPTFNGQISISNSADSNLGAVIDGNVIDGNSKTTYGIYAPNLTGAVGSNYVKGVTTSINTHWKNRLNVQDGYYRDYAERFELTSDGSRFATLNNRADNVNVIEIGVNKPLSIQSTVSGEGLARIRHRNNLQSTAASNPQNGDIHYTSTGLKVYVNGTWKDILFD